MVKHGKSVEIKPTWSLICHLRKFNMSPLSCRVTSRVKKLPWLVDDFSYLQPFFLMYFIEMTNKQKNKSNRLIQGYCRSLIQMKRSFVILITLLSFLLLTGITSAKRAQQQDDIVIIVDTVSYIYISKCKQQARI